MEKQNFYEKTEKKFIEFLREYNEPSRAKMFEELYKLAGVEFEYLWEYPQDYQNPANGSAYGLIYYKDTEPFARNNFDEIDEILTEYGHTKRIPLNEMTWAAWEELHYQFTTFKEEHKEQHPENEDEEDQTQEEPAQEEPAQEEPAQEEPAQEEPAQEEPAQEEKFLINLKTIFKNQITIKAKDRETAEKIALEKIKQICVTVIDIENIYNNHETYKREIF